MTEAPQATRQRLEDENAANADRRRWMAVLARAAPEDIALLWKAAIGPDAPEVDYLRPAETGMVMTRGRAGGTGDPFNLGEMTVTRCSVRLRDGTVGHAYAAGRSTRHAEMAAILDALLQSDRTAAHVHRTVIEPLAARQAARREARQRRAARTRVEFFTLVRGED
jgi:alpha-D-ribose 1-methylphosphonate 5-triphosphate synthase subunit PhnG